MFEPTRGGNRGGQGLFKWEDVKADKYRENYLGHSLKATVGRWQKNRDLQWYTKAGSSKGTPEDQVDELDLIRQQEAEAMAEALGYSGPKRFNKNESVSREELGNVLRREEFDAPDNAAAVKGIGFGRKSSHFVESSDAVTEPGVNFASSSAPQGLSPVQAGRVETQSDSVKPKKSHKKKKKKSKRHDSSSEDDGNYRRHKKRSRRDRTRSRSPGRRDR